MSGIYRNQSGINMISGTVESISPDKAKVVIKTTVGNKEKGGVDPKDYTVTFSGDVKLSDEIKVGDTITAAGYQNGQDSINALFASHENSCFKANDDLVIISGEVLFASKNNEKDENGQPRLTQAGTEKKPHFDITVAVGKGSDRVNHVIKVYDYAGNGSDKKEQKNIERFEKIFKNFDRKENPLYITIATGAGQEYTRTNKSKDGREFENKYESHLGFKSFNVQFLNSLNKTATKGAESPAKDESKAETKDAEADNLDFCDIDGIDDMDLEF